MNAAERLQRRIQSHQARREMKRRADAARRRRVEARRAARANRSIVFPITNEEINAHSRALTRTERSR